jgi:hypothetical protein
MECHDDIQSKTWEQHDLSRFDDVFNYIEDNIIERISNVKGKRMDVEFIDALNFLNNNILYRKNEIDFWTADDDIVQGEKCCEEDICECNKKCICGHHIQNLYYIKNDAITCSDSITCLVGSCCVKKSSTSSDLHNRLTKDRCVVCDTTLLDKRGKYQRNGYCSQTCSSWPKCGKWKIKQGSTITYYDKIKNNEIKYLLWRLEVAREKKQYTLAYYLQQHLQKKDDI